MSLKDFLMGSLSLGYPYTNDELLRLAKSQGHKVRVSDIRTVVTEIAADIRAGKSTMTYLRE